MLTALWTAYVDRFACDWPRLTTTDPYFNIIDYKLYLCLCLYLYYLQIIQTYVFINITVVRIKNASLNFNV